jgi:hypothetical protein
LYFLRAGNKELEPMFFSPVRVLIAVVNSSALLYRQIDLEARIGRVEV